VLTSAALGVTTCVTTGGGVGEGGTGVGIEAELPPPPLQAIREQITPMVRMPSSRT
jgi:hypothetical protein